MVGSEALAVTRCPRCSEHVPPPLAIVTANAGPNAFMHESMYEYSGALERRCRAIMFSCMIV
jgi:hypothetical protein